MEDFEEKNNFFFNQIVENENDLVGSIAYVIYKWNKIEYIDQFKKEHGNHEPSLQELREWQKGECAKSKLENYKKIAELKTADFVNNLQSDKEKQLYNRRLELEKKEREIKEHEKSVKELEKDLKLRTRYCHVKQKGQFWSGVSQSLVASFLFIVLCFILILFISGKTDIIEWGKNILEIGVK